MKKSEELLAQILNWTRILALSSLRVELERELSSEKARLIYHHSDGKSSRQVAKEAGYKDKKPVLRHWENWLELGIVEPYDVKGGGVAFKKIFELVELGFKVPKLKKK